MTRDEYTATFKAAFIEQGFDEDAFEPFESVLWINPRKGFRLDYTGFMMLCNHLELEPTEFVFQEWRDNQNKMLMALEKHMDTPYFLHPVRSNSSAYKSVSVFSGKIAMSIGLIGSVEQYIKNIKKTA